ncbi:MAG: carbohydrate binding family 9 domain-containing protein [Myxococcales bacterium FL481]|nr:MAG: carbohydrate binding family 9 domain-containing protein [Myxococcales bacterium FL481]
MRRSCDCVAASRAPLRRQLYARLVRLVVLLTAMACPNPVEAATRSLAATSRHGAIRIDGKLAEADWARARAATGFWQQQPQEGEPPRFQTEFRVLYDAEALYVGIRAYDPDPAEVRGLLTRRDADSSSDWLYVGIDSYYDRRTAFMFGMNAAGVQRDLLLFDDTKADDSWNAVWTGDVSIDDHGWVAEFRIPLSQLRFSSRADPVWGIQVRRVVQRTTEETLWTPTPRASPRFVSLFGDLTGVERGRRQRRLEMLPYVLGGASLSATTSDDPFGDAPVPAYRTGLDFRYGVTSNLTVSGTINPDFGQVEADPSQINLTAQEIFFADKRPFFLEGRDILRFDLDDGGGSSETLFYSRRIGAAPHGDGSELGDFSRQDANTSILGAAKLSGKTANGWSVGLMDALTAEEQAEVRHLNGAREYTIVEPMANYAIARVKKDVNGGRTSIGVGATSVHRRLKGTGFDDLHDSAYSGGVSLDHRSAADMWTFNLRLVGSHVRGSKTAIAGTQQAFQRYYQRPDADHLHFDPDLTRLRGLGGIGSVRRMGGTRWRGGLGFDTRTPGFEVNDVGFQRESDYIQGWGWVQLRDQTPGRVFREYYLNISGWTLSTFGAENVVNGGNFNSFATLNSFWRGNAGYMFNDMRVDTKRLRGGPSIRAERRHRTWLNVDSDARKRISASTSGAFWAVPGAQSRGTEASVSLVTQALSNLNVSLGPSFNHRIDDRQFVAETSDAAGENHYVLGRIEQVTLGLTVRANYTILRNLSLQLYAQPFLSSGRYTDYKEPDQPQASTYADRFHAFAASELEHEDGRYTVTRTDQTSAFSFDAADFDFGELRSNVVLRWEYTPGSTLSFIWAQGRSATHDDGQFDLGPDLERVLDAEGEHVVLLKLSHWFGA